MAKKAFAWLSAAKLSMHGEQKTDNVYFPFDYGSRWPTVLYTDSPSTILDLSQV